MLTVTVDLVRRIRRLGLDKLIKTSKLVKFIFNFIIIHPVVVEIFPSGPKRCTIRQTDCCRPRRPAADYKRSQADETTIHDKTAAGERRVR